MWFSTAPVESTMSRTLPRLSASGQQDVAGGGEASDMLVGQDLIDGRPVEVAVGQVSVAIEGQQDVVAIVNVVDFLGGAASLPSQSIVLLMRRPNKS